MATIKRIKYFDITQHEKEGNYLREMHKQGWKLVKVRGLGMYTFESCEPEDVVYQLDYNQQGISEKNEYVQMFEDCGWEYLQDYVGYSYFRKPASEMTDNEDSIFCDAESRTEMMKRVFKGRVLPLIIIFFCCIVTGLVRSLYQHDTVVLSIYLGLAALYIFIFLKFAISYIRISSRD